MRSPSSRSPECSVPSSGCFAATFSRWEKVFAQRPKAYAASRCWRRGRAARASASGPASLSFTARVSRTRLIQPCVLAMAGDRGAGVAGDVKAALAPVEAGAAEGAAAARGVSRSMPSSSKKAKPAGVTSPPSASSARKPRRDHGVGDLDRESSGEMVVAHARVAERRVGARERTPPGRRLDRRHHADRFHHLRDERRGDAKIAVPALLDDGEQLCFGEASQMLARRLRRDARRGRRARRRSARGRPSARRSSRRGPGRRPARRSRRGRCSSWCEN